MRLLIRNNSVIKLLMLLFDVQHIFAHSTPFQVTLLKKHC